MIKIRKANVQDMQSVLDLVVELAIYEKEPDAVTATVEDYIRDFEESVFDVIVAEDKNEIVGIMLYYLTFSTWKGRMLYLEDFVVKESMRGHGIGVKLFNALVEEAKSLNCVLIKWQVLDWNEPAINFYKKFDVTFEEEWYNCKLFL